MPTPKTSGLRSPRVPKATKTRLARPVARTKSAQPAFVPEGDIRVAVLTPIPALLRELKCDPEPVLSSLRLDLTLFDRPDTRISFATGGALLDACAAATGVPHFGLLVGARFDLAMLGVLAHLMRNSESVRAALLQFVRHLHLNDSGAVTFLLNLGEKETSFGYGVYRYDTPGIGQIYDTALAIGLQILRSLCGPSVKLTRVMFAHGAPNDVAPYRRYFGAPVHFDSPHSELILPARWLERPLAGADVSRRMEAERIALAAEQGDDGRLLERVQRAVHGLVMAGESSAQRIAALLGINERVLRRRLQAMGTNTHQMIGAARYEGACQLLRETQLPLPEIASALGYSDATAFSRAFRTWAHTTPSEWRSRVESPPATPIRKGGSRKTGVRR
jgi:AraC-like DNA-binding protein